MLLPSIVIRRQPATPVTPLNLVRSPESPVPSPPTVTPIAADSTKSTAVSTSTFIFIGVGVGILVLLFLAYFALKNYRKHHRNPTYIPGKFLKSKWTNWSVAPSSTRDGSSSHLEPISAPQVRRGQSPAVLETQHTGPAISTTTAATPATATVDRNTSVRSVMTLPPYKFQPAETEQVLGREGERAGIDVVVEYPENEAASEELRDEEMEALYQVRLARRQEIEAREERRRLRREARERNDFVELERLRQAAVDSETPRNLEVARATHAQVRDRPRTVSSVSYGDVGLARHDGTRIRANSEESERPLLGDAASLGEDSRRDRSNSVLSASSMGSDLQQQISRTRQESPMMRVGGVDHARSGSMSSPEMLDVEHSGDDFPEYEPPGYVDVSLHDTLPTVAHPHGAPPEYFSPVDSQAPQFPATGSNTSGGERDEANMRIPPVQASGRRSSRGVDGTPQLPSLRLASLPSIRVDAGTPIGRNRSEERN